MDSNTDVATGTHNANMDTTEKLTKRRQLHAADAEAVTPNPMDVLLGKGKKTTFHPGNERFRSIVDKHRVPYVLSPRSGTNRYAALIIEEVKSYGGRFLSQDDTNGTWHTINFDWAIEKARQALSEDAPILRAILAGEDDPSPKNKRPKIRTPILGEAILQDIENGPHLFLDEHFHIGLQEGGNQDSAFSDEQSLGGDVRAATLPRSIDGRIDSENSDGTSQTTNWTFRPSAYQSLFKPQEDENFQHIGPLSNSKDLCRKCTTDFVTPDDVISVYDTTSVVSDDFFEWNDSGVDTRIATIDIGSNGSADYSYSTSGGAARTGAERVHHKVPYEVHEIHSNGIYTPNLAHLAPPFDPQELNRIYGPRPSRLTISCVSESSDISWMESTLDSLTTSGVSRSHLAGSPWEGTNEESSPQPILFKQSNWGVSTAQSSVKGDPSSQWDFSDILGDPVVIDATAFLESHPTVS